MSGISTRSNDSVVVITSCPCLINFSELAAIPDPGIAPEPGELWQPSQPSGLSSKARKGRVGKTGWSEKKNNPNLIINRAAESHPREILLLCATSTSRARKAAWDRKPLARAFGARMFLFTKLREFFGILLQVGGSGPRTRHGGGEVWLCFPKVQKISSPSYLTQGFWGHLSLPYILLALPHCHCHIWLFYPLL